MPEVQTEPEVVVGPEPLAPRVVAVSAVGGATIRVAFEDAEVRTFDVAPLLTRGVFRQLAVPDAFAAISIVEGGGGVEWAAGPDLSANRLYFDGEPAEAA
ncbi:MAG: DUF2442 domain-containing protein [Bacteroidota bacterium]